MLKTYRKVRCTKLQKKEKKGTAMKCIYIPKSDLQKSTCTTIGKRVHAKHVAMNTKNTA